MRVASDVLQSKVTWLTVAAILTAISSALTDAISWPEAISAIFAALYAAFFRDTVARGHEDVIANVWAQQSDGLEAAAIGRVALADRTEAAIGSLRGDLAQALQVTAQNADRSLTLAENVADQAAALTAVQVDPVREAMEGKRRQRPSGFPTEVKP